MIARLHVKVDQWIQSPMDCHQFMIALRFLLFVHMKSDVGSLSIFTLIVGYLVATIENKHIRKSGNHHHSTLVSCIFLKQRTVLDSQLFQVWILS